MIPKIKKLQARNRWLLATWKADIKRITAPGQLWEIVPDPPLK
jgi:hypothetical protein